MTTATKKSQAETERAYSNQARKDKPTTKHARISPRPSKPKKASTAMATIMRAAKMLQQIATRKVATQMIIAKTKRATKMAA